jgi:hypothetical protein
MERDEGRNRSGKGRYRSGKGRYRSGKGDKDLTEKEKKA